MARCATAVGDAGKARRPNNRQTGTLSSVAAVLRKLPHERSHKPAASQKQLAEALEQQAATAEVLKVISGSTLELPAVLNIVVESACRLCEADIGTIRFEEDDRYRLLPKQGNARESSYSCG